ncbi:rho guanine nucleotide exchange factor TIAM2 [Genypterus blacodes]|uniref:rho guanine nucleotide exchange factor TIAM2 n=1 Tax=Genypterus blacodes TaxID=154954 RepID=UPI003F76A1A8
MGNAESQHSGAVSAGKPCSLRFHCRKQEVQSARSWWRGSQGGVAGRSRGAGRSHLSQHANNQSYGSWHFDPKEAGGSKLRARSPSQRPADFVVTPPNITPCFGYFGSSTHSNGIGICGRHSPDRTSLESHGSPKVLLSKDGSMRVEFSKTRVSPMEGQGLAPPAAATASETVQSLRTSKGSSLSSEGSWYDSPWGNGAEVTDNVFTCGQSVDNSSGYTTYSSTRTEETGAGYNAFFSTQIEDISPGFNGSLVFCAADTRGSSEFTSNGYNSTSYSMGYNTCSSGRTEDSGIGDSVILQPETRNESLYRSHDATAASLIVPPIQNATLRAASASSPLLDAIIQEEGSGGGRFEQRFSSCTLPCRRAEPVTAAGNSRKDFLKSRIRQLSDWTGSLSRKKRRIQEPFSSNASEGFCHGLDSATVCSSTLWSFNPLHTQNQNQMLLPHSSSSRSLSAPPNQIQNQSSDALRQNIYENFMQELETACSSERTDPSEGDGDVVEDEERGGEVDGEWGDSHRGSLEQLDSLFEEEQGVVRRAGWLTFKPLITLNKDRKLELVTRRKWRRYWVTLKGCTLLFFETYGKSGGAERELTPRYALLAEDSIVQAVPEHPKRENVFCLSNVYGDVFHFQATNQTDLENWVTAIHSASAALLARREGKEDTLRLLRSQNRSLLHNIDMDTKMKKMAELQLSVIQEPKNRKAVQSQIQQWEQNLEKLNLDLFRLRCYQSSLQGSELPNPKSLLAVASRPSKSTLGRLGVFSVSSFHALVCSRDEASQRWRCWSACGGERRHRGQPSSLRDLEGVSRKKRDSKHSATQRLNCVSEQHVVAPPEGHPSALQEDDELQVLSVCAFSVQLCRPDPAVDFGFAVTGHVDGVGKSHVYISEVDPLGLAVSKALRSGDEILAVNGVSVSGLDLERMQSLFCHQTLKLLIRRDQSRPEEPVEPTTVPPDPILPADPCQYPLLIPSDPPAWRIDSAPHGVPPSAVHNVSTSKDVEPPGLSMERVYSLYQTFPEGRAADVELPRNPYGRDGSLQPSSPAHLSVCQRLCKVVQELVDTEKSYVKDLVRLFDIYLTPLQKETFLSKDEMEALFGSLPEMLDFQRVFLQTLEERIASCPNLSSLETPQQFKKLLFSLGGSFLYYADHFKLYSGFCANHTKVQKVLERAKTDWAFKQFLEARNPTKQHSSTLESYLIKPVQRVLKYPLLLKELVSLTDPESHEHAHLTEALRAMEKVASHINDMQKIYEDYGAVFDQLAAEQIGPDREVTEISMGEFLVHSSVLWLNPLPCLGRLRKEPELTLFVFKRAVILVYRESSKLKKRMTSSRSADMDPFKFRWLIPVSAVQVRMANNTGTENPCVWELVHSRSELEGRPETVFQLCSSDLQTKAIVLRALRSLLRDGSRQTVRDSRSVSSSLRRRPKTSWSSEHGGSWRKGRQQSGSHSETRSMTGETCSEPLLPSHAASATLPRLGADDAGKRARLCSLTSELEAQLQKLNFTDDRSDEQRPRHGGEVLLPEEEAQCVDLSSLLERDFSIQSMTSMVNEDCFFDTVLGIHKPAVPTLQA